MLSKKQTILPLAVLFSLSLHARVQMIPPTDIDLEIIKNIHEGRYVLKNAKGDFLDRSKTLSAPPQNWFNLNSLVGVQGVGTELIYQTAGLPSSEKEIIVAVIDSGVDVNHEDLQGKIWKNEGEIADNQIDDDGNGYVDDVFGWNFIGGEKGMAQIIADENLENKYRLIKGDPRFQINQDTLEITRELVRLKKLKRDLDFLGRELSIEDQEQLTVLTKTVSEGYTNALSSLESMKKKDEVMKTQSQLLRDAGLTDLSEGSLRAFETSDESLIKAKNEILKLLSEGLTESRIERLIGRYTSESLYYYNESFNSRAIVGDDYSDPSDSSYGNNDVIGPDSSHGTHVAGIIAANRDNLLGIKGVATNVKIMAIRAIPDGDERDKDVANSIIYAVDNGAKIINMSFGKAASPYKKSVDEAMKYAEDNGVLLVHAAGNASQDNDVAANFPNRKLMKEKRQLSNWLEIGASSYQVGELLPAKFSNFGKNSVDLFSPGVDILSTVPGNKYDTFSGTSMASPVAAGVAAALWLYGPEMSIAELRAILVDTSRRFPKLKVLRPGTRSKVQFSDLSINGSVIDLYEATTTYLKRK